MKKNSLVIIIMVLFNVNLFAQAPASKKPQGKIISVGGRVEMAPELSTNWRDVTIFQDLFVKENVRTFVASRTALLFINEAQVKLNANSILTVPEVIQGREFTSILELRQGEVWVRTKNREGRLLIKAGETTSELNGTEINISLQPGNVTVLTVLEGSVIFSNNQGRIRVDRSEQATALPGTAPTKRRILNPLDAVQWSLYYPTAFPVNDLPAAAKSVELATGFARLKIGDPDGALRELRPLANTNLWARIGASMAYLELGNYREAKEVLNIEYAGKDILDKPDIDTRAQLAAIALATGDVRTAKNELRELLAIDPKALRALTLSSYLKLTQNKKREALKDARKALRFHPKSVAAYVAVSEVAQAYFDLDLAGKLIDKAIAIDNTDVRALVNRARLRFGSGDIKGAKDDVIRARKFSRNDAQVFSLLGFINLADGDLNEAEKVFKYALKFDSQFGEPHLGLGLIYFRQGLLDLGLLEMLTATLLEPKVSLYQSYLGKAYYQLRRFEEGLSALETAKRLDPRDPTPWLYESFFLRDLNRQVDALSSLQKSIALNDNRAVYRSRFLLDRDLATKNIGLAQVYRQLGFEAWGASEALKSLDADITNSSAHLFLAQTYINLPNRGEAGGSEFRQYFLTAPVNKNSFNSFAEYTSLFENPDNRILAFGEIGTNGNGLGNLGFRGGNNQIAYNGFVLYERNDGARISKADESFLGFLTSKFALGRKTDIFLNILGSNDDFGEETRFENFFLDLKDDNGVLTADVVFIEKFESDPNLNIEIKRIAGTLGLKHNWQPGSTFTSIFDLDILKFESDDPDAIAVITPPFLTSLNTVFERRFYDFQVQQVHRFGSNQFLLGGRYVKGKNNSTLGSITYLPIFDVVIFDTPGQSSSETKIYEGWFRDEIEWSAHFHTTLGIRYQDAQIGAELSDTSYVIKKLNPFIGLSYRISNALTLRAAAFRTLNTNLFGSKISPSTVSGFVIDRNELNTTIRRELNFSLEFGKKRTYLFNHLFYRDFEVPSRRTPQSGNIKLNSFDTEFKQFGINVSLNRLLIGGLSLFSDNEFIHEKTLAFERNDSQFRIGLNFIHKIGFFARVSNTYIIQKFSKIDLDELKDSSYSLTDVELKYEFPQKRGLIELRATNIFNQKFGSFIESLSISRIRPKRRIVLLLEWRL